MQYGTSVQSWGLPRPEIFPKRETQFLQGPIREPLLAKLRKVGEQRYCCRTRAW